LLSDENGLGDDRTDSARTQEPGERSDGMDEIDDEITHPTILARTASRCPKRRSSTTAVTNSRLAESVNGRRISSPKRGGKIRVMMTRAGLNERAG
jgi:hypothetical protein